MNKQNIPLIAGISIPILMIIFVAASIYLPRLFVPAPKYNFLYATDGDYYTRRFYSVQNDRLVENEIKYPEKYRPRRKPKFFVHDIVKNESKEIAFEDAQKLTLNSNVKSPDGFEVVSGTRHSGFFPFFFGGGRDYKTKYIKGRNTSKKLNLQMITDYYYRNFHFIGWITE